MRQHARVVVIGGGAMGVSLLYHLAKRGWSDVVLVEKHELTAGSTWHAAGLCTHFAHNATIMEMRAHSVRLYREILTIDPRQLDSLHLLGVIAHQRGRPKDAVDLIGQAIPRLKLQVQRSEIAEKGERDDRIDDRMLDDAIVCFRRALDLTPDHPELHNNLGGALQEQGLLDEAVACFRRAIDLRPNYSEAYNNLGVVLNRQRRHKEAAILLTALRDNNPDQPKIHDPLIEALIEHSVEAS